MRIKQLLDEDFVNYKKPSMVISCPYCTFKCDKENGCQLCQNMPLTLAPTLDVDDQTIINRYIKNDITKAIVFGGLEPLDSFDELIELIKGFRKVTTDDIIIYTGYNKGEILDKIEKLQEFKNIIVKFGRFIPNMPSRFDEVLGITLVSDNQYAEKIS